MVIRHIWIASHFHSVRRIELFKSTLQSIQNQVVKPDKVILSFSLQHDLLELKEEIINLKKCLTIPFTILFQQNRLYQFEHLHKIYEHVSSNDDEIYISFCDDDDFFHEHFIVTTNDFISLGYEKIKPKFYRIEDNVLYHDRFEEHKLGKYSEFGGMTCSLKFFKDFIESPFYDPLNKHCDIVCSCYTSDVPYKTIQINTPLYYYRSSMYTAHHKIWNFPKEITGSNEYKQIIEDTRHLKPHLKNHVISMWLYDAKDGNIHPLNKNEEYIEKTIIKYKKEMQLFNAGFLC